MDPNCLVKHAIEAPKKPLTLKEALSSVVDFRIDRRKKFPLCEILMIAVCAMVAGAKGPSDYERYGKAKLGLLRKFLRLENGIPSHDTGDALRAKCFSSQQPAISGQCGGGPDVRSHWLLAAGC